MFLIANPFFNPKLKIDEESHTYSHEDGHNLTSVSNLISNYKQPFDPDGHILRASAKKKGIPPEELREEWEKTKNDAATRGKSFHSQAEYYINTGKILDSDYKDVVQRFAERKYSGRLYSEVLVCSENHGIAGTIDLIEDLGNHYVRLEDFKTNKKLYMKSPDRKSVV